MVLFIMNEEKCQIIIIIELLIFILKKNKNFKKKTKQHFDQ